MTIPSQQPERWLAQAREIAHQLKTDQRVPVKDPLNIGIAFDDSIVNLTLDRGTIERLETPELAGLIYGLVLQNRTAAQQVPGEATNRTRTADAGVAETDRGVEGIAPLATGGRSDLGEGPTSPAAMSATNAGGADCSPVVAAVERCAVKEGDELCPNTAAGGLRVNLHAAPTIQKRYGRKVMLSLIFDLPVCLACFPKLTPANLMTDDQWRAFSKFAQQRNQGILADRAQTEIVVCQFEDPEYVTLREQIAKRAAANDSQPGPSGSTT